MLRRYRDSAFRMGLCASLVIGCGGTQQTPPSAAPEAPLVFADILPSGASRVVHLRLAALYESAALGPIARTIVRSEEQERLETRFGLRMEQVSELAVAIYGEEVLLVLRATRPVSANVHAIASRMNTVEFGSDEPTLRRSGFIGTVRREVAALGTHVLAYGTPGPSFDRLVSRSRGQPGGASIADALAAFPAPDALLTFYELRALSLPIDTPVGMLLAEQQSLQVRISDCDGFACVRAQLNGEFPDAAAGNLGRLAEALAASDLARVVAFDEAVHTLELEQSEGALVASVRWSSEGLREGVARIVAPDLATLLADEP